MSIEFAPYSHNSSRLENEEIRTQLALRYNKDHYEVYTTIHGTFVFRWFIVTEEVAQWYRHKFALPIVYLT